MKLAFQRVAGTGAAERRAVFLHGILGSGANLRTIARRFVTERAGSDAWTVDLRGHGASPKSSPDPTFAAAARDVLETTAVSDTPVEMVVGHSFGGKVALEALRQGLAAASLFTLDSPPGARVPDRGPDTPLAVIQMLRSLPPTFASREAFIDAVKARGHGNTLAQWLAMSTVADDGAVRFALDLAEIEALILDYFKADLWPIVEAPPPGVQIHLVIAGRSTAWSPEERERAHAVAARDERITVDVLDTDHWIHAEDPDGLIRLMLDRSP